MPPVVTYSLLGLCALVLVFGLVIERRRALSKEADARFARIRKYAWLLQVGAFVAAYFVLRPGTMPRDPREALRVAAAAREPVFIDMYSNY
jgi:hypothetical protein